MCRPTTTGAVVGKESLSLRYSFYIGHQSAKVRVSLQQLASNFDQRIHLFVAEGKGGGYVVEERLSDRVGDLTS